MSERVTQFRVGVMVLASALLAGIMIVLFGGEGDLVNWFSDKQTNYVDFPAAPGVTKDTPVRKFGILIGRVTDVQIRDDDARVTIEIDPGKVTQSDVCEITGTLLGDATLDFVPGEKADKQLLAEGAVIRGRVQKSPFEVLNALEGNIEGTLTSLTGAGDEVSKLAGRVNTMLGDNDEQVRQILANTNRAMVSFDDTLKSINAVIGDPQLQADLRASLERLPALLEKTQSTIVQMEQAVLSANENMKNLEGLTGPLKERGPQIVANVDDSIANLNEMMRQLANFTNSLNSSEGAVGQFVHNPELYQRLDRAAANIERLTQEMRPVMHDVRVFTDKIANDPGVLGVRGAIRREPGGKGG